ncbi:MAG TPA: DEAD/DEAH box helicase family protein [Thermomicrobiales bacterium]|nr:DEAD/DEAH box helicase family protein [Thermomicrobiales bacterium]
MDVEAGQVRARIDALQAELSADVAAAPIQRVQPTQAASALDTPQSAAEKVALFRRLFLGREDVYPVRFVSKKTGKAGYAPACRNKFIKGVCELPRVKCGACPNQAFMPADGTAVLDHLRGRHVMGVYPLLPDETCWFVAADFDGPGWIDDVRAFVHVCREAAVPVAIERSRSGNGAHAWFFFNEPMAATQARQMVSALLTRTMSGRHELAMRSYDRLFPNQDTMPKGGFGNLVALPLQREARGEDNSVFVDIDHPGLAPYPDQWAFLAGLRRVSADQVESIVEAASSSGGVIGLALPASEGAPDQRWLEPRTARRSTAPLTADMPPHVHMLIAQQVLVDKAGLPSSVLNAIKRLAAFQNPEFYKKQNLRLSTALTPRVIDCSDDLPGYIALPRGCLEAVEALIGSLGSRVDLIDRRQDGEEQSCHFQGQLRATQLRAVEALMPHETGVLVAPPGTGKTVVGAYMAAARKRNTLILVHRQPLLDQWRAQLAVFLGVDPKGIGQIGAGKRHTTGVIDVAMMQSLVRRDQVDPLVGAYGHVIVDECHHVPAVSFERVMNAAGARFVLGLTATPQRRDGHQPIIEMQLGPVRFAASRRHVDNEPLLHRSVIIRDTAFRHPQDNPQVTIQEWYAALASDERRNALILDDVIGALSEGRSPLLLTERRDHLEFFAARLKGFARHLVVLHGGTTAKRRQHVQEQLRSIPSDQERLVLATGRFVGEGFDDARLDTLFLALPISWKGTLEQYSGRLHRRHAGKTDVQIVDYVDRSVPMLRKMSERRLKGYRAIGYVVSDGSKPAQQRTLRVGDQEA